MKELKNKEWLRKKYCVERLSQAEIGRSIGVSGERVRQCLRKFGLHKSQQIILIEGNKLLEKEYIIEKKKKFQNNKNLINKRGVYFLLHNEKIIYIGSTNNLFLRLQQQKNNLQGWGSYFFITVSQKLDLEWEERKYIKKFKPFFNKRIDVVDLTKSKRRI